MHNIRKYDTGGVTSFAPATGNQAFGDVGGQAFSNLLGTIGGGMLTSSNGAIRGIGSFLFNGGSQIAGNFGKAAIGALTHGANFGKAMSNGADAVTGMFQGSAGIGSGLGIAGNVMSSIAGPKREYAGPNGAITQGMDSAYDTATSVIGSINPLVGGILAANKGLTSVANKMGMGTDSMTKTDAILGSNLLGGVANPLTVINGFGGKKAHTMGGKDFMTQENLNNVWSGYAGTNGDYNDALTKEGKKYGLFSSGARKKANRLIDSMNMTRTNLLDMNNQASLGDIKGNLMVDQNTTAYNMNIMGYNPYLLRAGKHGTKLPSYKDLLRIRRLVSEVNMKPAIDMVEVDLFASGGKLIKVKTYDGGEMTIQEPDKDLIAGRKPVGMYKGLPMYLGGDGIAGPNANGMQSHKQGGILSAKLNWKPVIQFKQGGQMNVIPEGALHARKNNMDVEDITKKGIPVVDNNGLQLAEIEKNEIIFRKEVTDKLEELAKDGSNKAAEEAGKLLVKEIFQNTDDRTGLIKEVTGEGKSVEEKTVENHEAIPMNLNGGITRIKPIDNNGNESTTPNNALGADLSKLTNDLINRIADTNTMNPGSAPSVNKTNNIANYIQSGLQAFNAIKGGFSQASLTRNAIKLQIQANSMDDLTAGQNAELARKYNNMLAQTKEEIGKQLPDANLTDPNTLKQLASAIQMAMFLKMTAPLFIEKGGLLDLIDIFGGLNDELKKFLVKYLTSANNAEKENQEGNPRDPSQPSKNLEGGSK